MQRRGLDFLKHIVLISLLGLLWAASAQAQIERATLTGTVTDPSGASVPGARVEIISPSTGFERHVDTGDAGVYSVTDLPIGTYTITITRDGFKTFEEKGIELFVRRTRTADAQLEVGAASARVEVQFRSSKPPTPRSETFSNHNK